jgi:hypothetical protein
VLVGCTARPRSKATAEDEGRSAHPTRMGLATPLEDYISAVLGYLTLRRLTSEGSIPAA